MKHIEMFEWLEECVGPTTYKSSEQPEEIKNRFSHDYVRRGDDWTYRFLITCNKQEFLPEKYADTWVHQVAGMVYEYTTLEFKHDAHAVHFRLLFGV
jgi:hypothetical protein